MRIFLMASSLLLACKTEAPADDTGELPPVDTADEPDSGDTDSGDTADTEPPEETGESLFMDHCSKCHAPDGSGTSIGPPILYEVDRLDDAYLLDVILNGRGNMDPIDVTPSQAQLIVDFMRSPSF